MDAERIYTDPYQSLNVADCLKNLPYAWGSFCHFPVQDLDSVIQERNFDFVSACRHSHWRGVGTRAAN